VEYVHDYSSNRFMPLHVICQLTHIYIYMGDPYIRDEYEYIVRDTCQLHTVRDSCRLHVAFGIHACLFTFKKQVRTNHVSS